MSKRLQVILQDPEYRESQRAARLRHLSIAEWVRQALQLARRSEPQGAVGKKLGVIRAATRLDYPPADLERMLREIEAGYGSAGPDSPPAGKPASGALILMDSNLPGI